MHILRLTAAVLLALFATTASAVAQSTTIDTLTLNSQILFGATAQEKWGTGAGQSWDGNFVDQTNCPLAPTTQVPPFFAAHCWQIATKTGVATPQGALAMYFIANANTQGGGNEAPAMLVTVEAKPGAPRVWAGAFDIVFDPGSFGGPAVEADITNEDCDPGNPLTPIPGCGNLKSFVSYLADGIGSNTAGVFPGTAAFWAVGSNTGPIWHVGFMASGDGVKDYVFGDLTSAPTSLAIFGSKQIGVDCFFGTFSIGCVRLAANQKIVMNGSTGRALLDNGTYMTTLGDFYSANPLGTVANLGAATSLSLCAQGGGGTEIGWNKGAGTQEADIFSCQATGAPANQGGFSVYVGNTDGTIGNLLFALNGFGQITTPLVSLSGSMTFGNLPTADPHVVGRVWQNGAVLQVSLG